MILYGHSTDNSAKIFSKVVFSHVDNYLQTTNDDTPLQPLDGFTFDIQRFDFSGSGTETDPYEISTAADLQQLATDVNGGNTYSGSYFKVTANIDLSELGEDYSGRQSAPVQKCSRARSTATTLQATKSAT